MSKFLTTLLDVSQYGERGYYDETSQYQYVFPKSERIVDTARNVLIIGAAGSDGIEFVMKPNEASVFAFYPREGTVQELAKDFDQFVEGWISGDITV